MPMWKEKATNYFSWPVCLAWAGLLFSIAASNATLFVLLIFCLLSFSFSGTIAAIRGSLPVKLILLFYILHLPGLLYSENLANGWFVLEKKVTLLLLPLLLFPAWQSVPHAVRSSTGLRLGAITIGSSMVFLIWGFIEKFVNHSELAFHRDHFASIPYVFYSIYFAIGSLIFLGAMYVRWKSQRMRLIGSLSVVLYSLALLVVISSKTGILAYVVGIGYFLFVKVQSRKFFYLSAAGVVVSLLLMLAIYPETLNRFTELTSNLSVLQKDKLVGYEEFTGLNLRLFFWKISIGQLWLDGNMVAGVGTGDAQDYLDMTYKIHHLDQYGYLQYDAHNQWVMTLLQLGLTGVACLAATFIAGFRAAQKAGDINFRFFLWIILCFSFSESLMEANKGVVLFALLFAILCPLGVARASK
jgi:O-antigen ligase